MQKSKIKGKYHLERELRKRRICAQKKKRLGTAHRDKQQIFAQILEKAVDM